MKLKGGFGPSGSEQRSVMSVAAHKSCGAVPRPAIKKEKEMEIIRGWTRSSERRQEESAHGSIQWFAGEDLAGPNGFIKVERWMTVQVASRFLCCCSFSPEPLSEGWMCSL